MDLTLLIPEGFTFDGASVPRVFWPILNPTGILLVPGLFHDFAYKYRCYISVEQGIVHADQDQRVYDTHFAKNGELINGFKCINGSAAAVLKSAGYVAWDKHRKANRTVQEDFPQYCSKNI